MRISDWSSDVCSSDLRPPHVISEVHGTSANIDSIASCDIETGTQIYLVLDDGAAFRTTVAAGSSSVKSTWRSWRSDDSRLIPPLMNTMTPGSPPPTFRHRPVGASRLRTQSHPTPHPN